MGGFSTVVIAPRTSQITADAPLDMKGYRIINVGKPISASDALPYALMLALGG